MRSTPQNPEQQPNPPGPGGTTGAQSCTGRQRSCHWRPCRWRGVQWGGSFQNASGGEQRLAAGDQAPRRGRDAGAWHCCPRGLILQRTGNRGPPAPERAGEELPEAARVGLGWGSRNWLLGRLGQQVPRPLGAGFPRVGPCPEPLPRRQTQTRPHSRHSRHKNASSHHPREAQRG